MLLSINNVSAKRELVIGTEYDINVKVIDEDNNLVRNTLLCLYDYKYLQMECLKTNHYGKTRFNVLSGKYFIRQETVEGDYIKIDKYDLDVQDDIDLVLVNEFIKKEEPIIIEEPVKEEPIKEEQPVIEQPIIDEPVKEEIVEKPITIEEPIIEETIKEEIPVKEEINIPVKEEIPVIIDDKKESAVDVNNKNITKSTNNSKKAVKTPKNSEKTEDNTLLAMNIGVDSDNKGALVYSESKENDKSVDNSQVIFYIILIALFIIFVGIIINKIRVKIRQKV
jgi:hypothetical protein